MALLETFPDRQFVFAVDERLRAGDEVGELACLSARLRPDLLGDDGAIGGDERVGEVRIADAAIGGADGGDERAGTVGQGIRGGALVDVQRLLPGSATVLLPPALETCGQPN